MSTPVATAQLELKDVTKRFGGVAALDGVSFSCREGEILGLLVVAVVVFVPRGVIDFFGGQSRLSLGYLRRSLRETSV